MRWSVLVVIMLLAAGTARAEAERGKPRILKLRPDATITLRFDDAVVPAPPIAPRVLAVPLASLDGLTYPRGMLLATPPIPHRRIAVTVISQDAPITDDARGNVLVGIGAGLAVLGAWVASRQRTAAQPVML